MKFCIEKDGSLVIGGSPWNKRVAKLCGLQNNKTPPTTPYILPDGSTLRKYKVNKAYPTVLEHVTTPSGSIVGDDWVITEGVIDVSLEEGKRILSSKVPIIRYKKEVGGIDVDSYQIDTDRASQGKWTAAWIKAKYKPLMVLNWKTNVGFVSLDATQITFVGDAVASHVEACFNHEQQLLKDIDDANNLNQLGNVDIYAGWPLNIGEE